MDKIVSRIILLMQCIVTFILGALVIHTFSLGIGNGRATDLGLYLETAPEAIVLFFSLISSFLIKIRHRSHTPEGGILPLLFLFMSLQCVAFIPDYFTETGILIFAPTTINVLIRFSFLSCAVLFIFTSLLYLGSNITQTGTYVLIALACSLVLSIMAPNTSAAHENIKYFGSIYDVYFSFAIGLINLASIATYVIAAINEKTAHNIKRSISYILLIIGNYGMFSAESPIMILLVCLLFIVGFIMLIITSKETF